MEYGIYAMCKLFWLEKMGDRDRLLKNLPFHDVEEKQSGDTKTGSVHGAVAVQTQGQPRQSPWQLYELWQEGT